MLPHPVGAAFMSKARGCRTEKDDNQHRGPTAADERGHVKPLQEGQADDNRRAQDGEYAEPPQGRMPLTCRSAERNTEVCEPRSRDANQTAAALGARISSPSAVRRSRPGTSTSTSAAPTNKASQAPRL